MTPDTNQDHYAPSVCGRPIGRWDAKKIEDDNALREALMLVRENIALQVGDADPVSFLTAKLEEKFPDPRTPIHFASGVSTAIQSGFIVFDEEHGVLQLGKNAETGLNEMDIIRGSFGASRVRHWEGNAPCPTLYCWYSGGLM